MGFFAKFLGGKKEKRRKGEYKTLRGPIVGRIFKRGKNSRM
tara:strand:+ start:165 stop:287 length:123 start_codon:yes stop_codon:yes gene_type:complete